MLILTRRKYQKIKIGDDIVVTITKISDRGLDVSVGIDAPPHIEVHREEIYDRIKRAKVKQLEKEKEAVNE